MAKRRLRIALLCVVFGLLPISLFIITACLDKSPFERIQLGMPRNQVHSLLGKPSVWWHASDLLPDSLLRGQRIGDQWSTGNETVVIGYDSDDAVVSKERRAPGMLETIARFLKRIFGT
jgi:hypothetical protein